MESDQTKLMEIITLSGNSFQCKVIKFFRENGWEVTVSPYYNDNLSDKPREIDIIATKKYPVKGFFNNHAGSVVTRLFIECKYIAEETVFWFDNIDKNSAIKRSMQDTGLEDPKINIKIESHHYITTKEVAKLFASHQRNQKENDFIYKAINQCLNATLYYKNRLANIYDKQQNDNVLRVLNYPVIICDKFQKFSKTDFDNKSPETITDNFIAEINYAYLNQQKENRDEYFLVDIVDYNKLSDYLNTIESNDIKKVVEDQSEKSNSRNMEQVARSDYSGFYPL